MRSYYLSISPLRNETKRQAGKQTTGRDALSRIAGEIKKKAKEKEIDKLEFR